MKSNPTKLPGRIAKSEDDLRSLPMPELKAQLVCTGLVLRE